MGITGVNSATQAATVADSAAKKATLDYDTFLTLFVEQMRNQDPTAPMDSTEQIAQLATFSQVEQTIQTNKNLEMLLQSSNLSQASSMIGRTLSDAGGSTTGVVKEVKVTSNGLVAILDSGKELAVTSGVKIS